MITKINCKLPAGSQQSDKDAFAAIGKVENYNPAASELSLDNLRKAVQDMLNLQSVRIQKHTAYKSADDDAHTAGIEFHNLIRRVKKHVLAQSGEDSNEAHVLGLKKQSEHKVTGRKKVAINKASLSHTANFLPSA
jgi:hypothetical protein